MLELTKTGTYTDGGTTSYQGNDGVEYCIDNKIGTNTRGKLFIGYPLDNKQPIEEPYIIKD